MGQSSKQAEKQFQRTFFNKINNFWNFARESNEKNYSTPTKLTANGWSNSAILLCRNWGSATLTETLWRTFSKELKKDFSKFFRKLWKNLPIWTKTAYMTFWCLWVLVNQNWDNLETWVSKLNISTMSHSWQNGLNLIDFEKLVEK